MAATLYSPTRAGSVARTGPNGSVRCPCFGDNPGALLGGGCRRGNRRERVGFARLLSGAMKLVTPRRRVSVAFGVVGFRGILTLCRARRSPPMRINHKTVHFSVGKQAARERTYVVVLGES